MLDCLYYTPPCFTKVYKKVEEHDLTIYFLLVYLNIFSCFEVIGTFYSQVVSFDTFSIISPTCIERVMRLCDSFIPTAIKQVRQALLIFAEVPFLQ